MIDLGERCKDSLWVRTHIDARIPDVSAAHLIDPAWLDHHRAAQRPAVPRNHHINTTRRISCDLSEGVGRDSTCIMVLYDWGLLEVVPSNGTGLPEAAATIQRLARQWNVPHHMITYDKLGIGRNFPPHLTSHVLPGRLPGLPGCGAEAPDLQPGRQEDQAQAQGRVGDHPGPFARRGGCVDPEHDLDSLKGSDNHRNRLPGYPHRMGRERSLRPGK